MRTVWLVDSRQNVETTHCSFFSPISLLFYLMAVNRRISLVFRYFTVSRILFCMVAANDRQVHAVMGELQEEIDIQHYP